MQAAAPQGARGLQGPAFAAGGLLGGKDPFPRPEHQGAVMSSFLGACGQGLDTPGPSPRLAASVLSHCVRELFFLVRRVAALKKKEKKTGVI